jgi:DNA modification methylase
MAKMASIHADQTTIPSDYLASFVIHAGNNLDVLPTLPDNSVDSIVTDPPYELGFMGKKWDNSGIAYSVELWKECLRVLKPGGHLLSFGGTRTWHRVAVAIEDAGFDVRDSIAWMYGSGFPKSLDVSKAIDKSDAAVARNQRDLKFVTWMRSTGMKAKDANTIVEKADVASHYFRLDQPVVATAELFDKLRPHLPEVPDYIEKMVAERTIESENFKNREVIGQKTGTKSLDGAGHGIVPGGTTEAVNLDITAPSTPEAEQWQGWGTALKPAFEPIVVARKPLAGKTVAANVLEHGTGALNIDGSRIAGDIRSVWQPSFGVPKSTVPFGTGEGRNGEKSDNTKGRWPANVILDEYSAGELDEQSGVSKSASGKVSATSTGDGTWSADDGGNFDAGRIREWQGFGDTGGASRFFYCAKASKRDRNEGLEGLEAKAHSEWPQGGIQEGSSRGATSQNFHPTVKPTNLMRYLVKLVTPPGGTVLDPFTGSGSTGKAAILEGFDFIGIEMTEEYLPIIDARLKHAEQVRDQQEQAKDEGLF